MQDQELSNVTELKHTTPQSQYDVLVADSKEVLVSLDKMPALFHRLIQSHEEMSAARFELEDEVSELNNDCRCYKETTSRYENDVIRLREREEILKAKLEKESCNLKVMQGYRVDAESDLREYKSRVFKAEMKLENLTSQKMSLEKVNSDYDGKLQDTRETLTALETKMDFLQQAKLELEIGGQSLREELTRKETIVEIGEAKLEQSENKINQLSLETANLSEENEHINRAREESSSAHNTELESARTRARKMEGLLEESRARSHIDSQRAADTRKENVQLSFDASQKDDLVKSLSEQISEADARSQVSTELQTEMDNRHADLLDKNQALQDELNTLREENATVSSQKKLAEKSVDTIQNDFKSTVSMFEKRLINLENENADLRKQARLGDEPRIVESLAVESASYEDYDDVMAIR